VGVGVGAFWLGKSSGGPKVVVTPTPTVAPTVSESIPTLDPTAGWKTYTNTKYNYQLKYPSSWEIYLPRGLSSLGLEGLTEVDFYPQGKNSILTINVLTATPQTIISDLESSRWGRTSESLEMEEIEIAGIKGKKISGTDVPTGGALLRVIFSKDNLTYDVLLKLRSEEINLGYTGDTFNQILSTFKFLD